MYHPLETTRWSTERMDEVGIVGFGIRSFASECQYSWSAGLTSMSWVIYTIIGIYYFYSRYAAWNELTAMRVAQREAAEETGASGRKGHARHGSFSRGDDPRVLAAERALRKKQHKRTESSLSAGTGAAAGPPSRQQSMNELADGFGDALREQREAARDGAATADGLQAAGADDHGIELEDVAHVQSWIAEGGTATAAERGRDAVASSLPPNGKPPRPGGGTQRAPTTAALASRASVGSTASDGSQRRRRLISPARVPEQCPGSCDETP